MEDDPARPAIVSAESSWVFTFGRDCNGELGRLPAGALDSTGNPAAGHPAASAPSATTAPALEPETPTDPAKAQLKSHPWCVAQLSDLPNSILSVGSGFYHSAAVNPPAHSNAPRLCPALAPWRASAAR